MLDMLIEYLLEVQEAILAWWSPSSVYVGPPDDAPYLPFRDWFRFCEDGLADRDQPPDPKYYSMSMGYAPPPTPPPGKRSTCICM